MDDGILVIVSIFYSLKEHSQPTIKHPFTTNKTLELHFCSVRFTKLEPTILHFISDSQSVSLQVHLHGRVRFSVQAVLLMVHLQVRVRVRVRVQHVRLMAASLLTIYMEKRLRNTVM